MREKEKKNEKEKEKEEERRRRRLPIHAVRSSVTLLGARFR